MAVYTHPTAYLPEVFEIALRSSVEVSTSPLNGSVQTVENPGVRWVVSLTYPRIESARPFALAAFWAKVGGQANRVGLWHMARPVPRGTLRGAPVLASTAVAGAVSAAITTTAAATLLVGDMVTIGGQLVQVVTDTTADGLGAMTVAFVPRLRLAATSGSEVGWDKPKASFVLTSGDVRLQYGKALSEGFTVELVESGTYVPEVDLPVFIWDSESTDTGGWNEAAWAS